MSGKKSETDTDFSIVDRRVVSERLVEVEELFCQQELLLRALRHVQTVATDIDLLLVVFDKFGRLGDNVVNLLIEGIEVDVLFIERIVLRHDRHHDGNHDC